MIVFFHGFAATGHGSSKAAALRRFFHDQAEVVTPTYPCGDPVATFEVLQQTVADAARAGEPLLIGGISFGGFWARRLADAFPGAGLLLINPALDGAATLARYRGENVNYDSGETFVVSDQAVTAAAGFAIAADRPDLPVLLLVATDDDVVPPQPALRVYQGRDNTQVVALNDAGHRFSRFEEVLGEIGAFHGRLAPWKA